MQLWDTTNLRTANRMFDGATSFNVDLTNWMLPVCTEMDNFLNGATAYSVNLVTLDVPMIATAPTDFATNANIVEVQYPVFGVLADDDRAGLDQAIAAWKLAPTDPVLISHIVNYDTSLITDFRDLNLGSRFNLDISGWDLSAATNCNNMFKGASSFDQDISGWNVSNVIFMNGMFEDCHSFNQNIGGWIIAAQTMISMFKNCHAFNQPLATWNVSLATNTSFMFQNCHAFDQSISGWNTQRVRSFESMFEGCTVYNQPMSTWTISPLNIEFCNMFKDAKAFNQDIPWVLGGVGRSLEGMFRGAESFASNTIASWNMATVDDVRGMLMDASAFNHSLLGWDVSNINNNPDINDASKDFALGSSLEGTNNPFNEDVAPQIAGINFICLDSLSYDEDTRTFSIEEENPRFTFTNVDPNHTLQVFIDNREQHASYYSQEGHAAWRPTNLRDGVYEVRVVTSNATLGITRETTFNVNNTAELMDFQIPVLELSAVSDTNIPNDNITHQEHIFFEFTNLDARAQHVQLMYNLPAPATGELQIMTVSRDNVENNLWGLQDTELPFGDREYFLRITNEDFTVTVDSDPITVTREHPPMNIMAMDYSETRGSGTETTPEIGTFTDDMIIIDGIIPNLAVFDINRPTTDSGLQFEDGRTHGQYRTTMRQIESTGKEIYFNINGAANLWTLLVDQCVEFYESGDAVPHETNHNFLHWFGVFHDEMLPAGYVVDYSPTTIGVTSETAYEYYCLYHSLKRISQTNVPKLILKAPHNFWDQSADIAGLEGITGISGDPTSTLVSDAFSNTTGMARAASRFRHEGMVYLDFLNNIDTIILHCAETGTREEFDNNRPSVSYDECVYVLESQDQADIPIYTGIHMRREIRSTGNYLMMTNNNTLAIPVHLWTGTDQYGRVAVQTFHSLEHLSGLTYEHQINGRATDGICVWGWNAEDVIADDPTIVLPANEVVSGPTVAFNVNNMNYS